MAKLEERKKPEYLKKQNWTITNYAALIYGALLSVKHFAVPAEHPLDPWQVVLLQLVAVVAVVAGAFGVGLVLFVHKHMRDVRKEIKRAEKWIFGEYKEGANTERSEIVGPDDEDATNRDVPFLGAQILVLVGGALLVVCFLQVTSR